MKKNVGACTKKYGKEILKTTLKNKTNKTTCGSVHHAQTTVAKESCTQSLRHGLNCQLLRTFVTASVCACCKLPPNGGVPSNEETSSEGPSFDRASERKGRKEEEEKKKKREGRKCAKSAGLFPSRAVRAY